MHDAKHFMFRVKGSARAHEIPVTTRTYLLYAMFDTRSQEPDVKNAPVTRPVFFLREGKKSQGTFIREKN